MDRRVKEAIVTGRHSIIPYDKYWVSNNCLLVDNLGAVEYTIMLSSTLASIRIKDNQVIEMYFFDRTENQQILSVTQNDFNRYTQINGIITRDDGAVYEYTDTGLVRKGDNRTYTCGKCDPTNLPNVVYTAYYFLRTDKCLARYNTEYYFDINRLCVAALQKLITKINTYDKTDKANLVKNNLILWEY